MITAERSNRNPNRHIVKIEGMASEGKRSCWNQ